MEKQLKAANIRRIELEEEKEKIEKELEKKIVIERDMETSIKQLKEVIRRTIDLRVLSIHLLPITIRYPCS